MTGTEQFAVVSPTGSKPEQPSWTPAPGQADLTGKTIAELWDYGFCGDIMYEVIREELSARFEGLTFVHWSEFGNTHGPFEPEVIAALPSKLREFDVDLAISSVGA